MAAVALRHGHRLRTGLSYLTRYLSGVAEPESMKDMVRETAMRFGEEELAPHAAEWDATKHFPVETFRNAAEIGFGAVYVDDKYGGSGFGRQEAAAIFEALAYHDISFATYLTIHNMNCYVIENFANDKLRDRLLPDMCSMKMFSSYCLTEPGSGSDAASLRTTAKKDGDDYILNGSKAFISGAGTSDIYLVMARTGEAGPKGITCFALEKGMAGLSFGKNEEKMGWKSQPTRAVIMEDVRVPAGNMVGELGDGFKIAMKALDGGRINIATCSVGGAAFCVDAATRYAQERSQFGKSISQFQYSQFKLADMATSVEASRLMVENAARAFDDGLPTTTVAAAMAKRFATDTCYDVANNALQMYGGYGYLQEYPIERYVRDLRVHSILEGTNEVMRMIISRDMLK